jgi:hypothetical protein
VTAALTALALVVQAQAQAPAAPPEKPAGAAAAPAVPVTVGKVLADRRYRFCHDPQYPLTEDEVGWCQVAPGKDERCPAWSRICAAGARAQLVKRDEPMNFRLPSLPAGGRLLVWILLGAAAAVAVAVLLRQLISQRRPAGGGEAEHPAASPGVSPEAALAAVETDVFRLLERARAAAAAGDFRRALDESYAALLRKLEGNNLIRVERHRTNGDYLADLRQRGPALRPRVAAVVAAVERVEFGGEPAGEPAFRWVHDRVVALCAERVAAALVLAAALLTGAAGCQPQREAWDDSPSGRGALLAVLNRHGLQARERILPVARLAHGPGANSPATLVLLPAAPLEQKDWDTLGRWVEEGGTLVLAGDPGKRPAWLAVDFARRAPGASAAGAGGDPLRLGKDVRERLGPMAPVAPPSAVALEAKEAEPLLFRRHGGRYAVEREHGDGRLLVFADDRLFTNAALLAGDNARLLVALLGEAGPRVELGGDLLGIVAEHPAAAVSRGKLAPALLQLGLLALLFFLYKGAHFGRPRDPVGGRRRVFADHVRALGLLYARARAGRLALEHYGAFAIERLGERLRMQGQRSLSAMAEAVATRTGRPVGEVMRVLLEARETAPAPAPGASTSCKAARGTPEDAEALVTLRTLAALLSQAAGPARSLTPPMSTASSTASPPASPTVKPPPTPPGRTP